MVVAFTTLRGGPAAAFSTMGAGLLVVAVLMALVGLPISLTLLAFVCWIPAAISAEVLRSTTSLAAAVGIIALLALSAVLALLALQSPMEAFWQAALDQFKSLFNTLLESGGESLSAPMAELKDELLLALLQSGAGISLLIFCTAGLFLARSGQAKLFNPGGFQKEFHSLYFGKQVGIFCVGLIGVGFLVGGALGITLTIVALYPLLLQGLAIIHALVKQRSLGVGWLVALYFLLVYLQPLMILISVFGFIDNIRRLPRH